MKKFFFVLTGVFALIAIIIIAVNFQFQVQYWLFQFKNESPAELLSMLFLLGLFAGMFLVLGFTTKKVDAGDNDF